jgi:hypothetical protein
LPGWALADAGLEEIKQVPGRDRGGQEGEPLERLLLEEVLAFAQGSAAWALASGAAGWVLVGVTMAEAISHGVERHLVLDTEEVAARLPETVAVLQRAGVDRVWIRADTLGESLCHSNLGDLLANLPEIVRDLEVDLEVPGRAVVIHGNVMVEPAVGRPGVEQPIYGIIVSPAPAEPFTLSQAINGHLAQQGRLPLRMLGNLAPSPQYEATQTARDAAVALYKNLVTRGDKAKAQAAVDALLAPAAPTATGVLKEQSVPVWFAKTEQRDSNLQALVQQKISASGLVEPPEEPVEPEGVQELRRLKSSGQPTVAHIFYNEATLAVLFLLDLPALFPNIAVVDPLRRETLVAMAEEAGFSKEQVAAWEESYLIVYSLKDTERGIFWAKQEAERRLARHFPGLAVEPVLLLPKALDTFRKKIEDLLRSFGLTFQSEAQKSRVTEALYRAAQA